MRAFEADAEFSEALAKFQAMLPVDGLSPIQAAREATAHGFGWFCRPSKPGFVEVRLRHLGGAEICAEGTSVPELLAGLLGLDLAALAQAAEPEQEAIALGSSGLSYQCDPAGGAQPHVEDATRSPAQVAAESLAAATGGIVVADSDELDRLAEPLTAEQKALAVSMISSLSAEARKAFAISFRDAFRVPREAKAIAPLITHVRHLEFCDTWSIEAAGGVAP
jgi:hypothetical protein